MHLDNLDRDLRRPDDENSLLLHFVGVGHEGQPWLELLSARYLGFLHKGDLSAGLNEEASFEELDEMQQVK